MSNEVIIILAEDNNIHAKLINKNLKRKGISNTILHFKDGVDTLNFLFRIGDGPRREAGVKYILLLDIRMPLIDGIEVMRQVKQEEELHDIPIIMVSNTVNPLEILKCWELGCNNYFIKAGWELGCNNYFIKSDSSDKLFQPIKQLGQYINEIILPEISNQ